MRYRPIHLAVFAVGTGVMESNEVRPPVSHVAVYMLCSKRYHVVVYIFMQHFRGFTVVWKRQEQYELVLVIIAAVSWYQH